MILQPAPADRIARISIRTPRAGSDTFQPPMRRFCPISIHAPRAGSDILSAILFYRGSDFNPRSPCGERQGGAGNLQSSLVISIHAPRAGSDVGNGVVGELDGIFQSTLPVRGATGVHLGRPKGALEFQSMLPVRGATRDNGVQMALLPEFQSMLPVRGATNHRWFTDQPIVISIHAPRAGSDLALNSVLLL